VKETRIEKRGRSPLKERGQYTLGFSVIALMLYVAGFPIFLLFFLGVLAFFIWKVFSTESRSDTRRIFEFYLAANEMLRQEDRRWFGYEIQETIERGESINRSMSAAPPLVYFCLGALYQKLGDHASTVKYLSQVVDEPILTEIGVMFPTRELREYVRTLRKIERYPAEAPLTSSAVRSLERARKNRGPMLLEQSKSLLASEPAQIEQRDKNPTSVVDKREQQYSDANGNIKDGDEHIYTDDSGFEFSPKSLLFTSRIKRRRSKKKDADQPAERKTISEVLHDIYDKNVQ